MSGFSVVAAALASSGVLQPREEHIAASEEGWKRWVIRCRIPAAAEKGERWADAEFTKKICSPLLKLASRIGGEIRCSKEYLQRDSRILFAYTVEITSQAEEAQVAAFLKSVWSGKAEAALEEVASGKKEKTGIQLIDSPDPVIEKPLAWAPLGDRNRVQYIPSPHLPGGFKKGAGAEAKTVK